MTNQPAATNWPYLSLTLPEGAESELVGLLAQAALDAGALGSMHEKNQFLVYLAQDTEPATREAIRAAVLAEAEGLGWGNLENRWETLADFPWATAWKEYFKATPVGKRLLVRPDWEQGQPAPPEFSGRLPLWLRPGFGFGTGHHETTRLALEMLESHLSAGDRVLDFGSGSGILSIAAARLGAAEVAAVEFDPDANANARENLELNDCTARVRIFESNHPAVGTPGFDLIICNMLPHNALPHLHTLTGLLARPQSVLIYSGFLVDQQDEIKSAVHEAGLTMQGFGQMKEWAALAAVRSLTAASKS